MSRELLAGELLVWLIGALVGWCVGWAARTDQTRAWHAGLRRQLQDARIELEQLQDELAQALDALDEARAGTWQATRTAAPPPPPAVVQQLNLAMGVPPARDPTGVIPSVPVRPVLPARGDQ